MHNPDVSSVNFRSGQTVPNAVIVPLGRDGRIDIFNALGTTQVLVHHGLVSEPA
jgi:hypothetical protein